MSGPFSRPRTGAGQEARVPETNPITPETTGIPTLRVLTLAEGVMVRNGGKTDS